MMKQVQQDIENNHPVSAIALPPLHRGEQFPSCGGAGVVNNKCHSELI